MKSEDEHSGVQSSDKQTLKADCEHFDSMNNQVQSYSYQKGTLHPQLNLICEVLSELLIINWIFLEVDFVHMASQYMVIANRLGINA